MSQYIDKEEKYDRLYQDALKLRDSGHPEESLRALSSLIGIDDESDARVLVVMGTIYLESKDFIEAVNLYKKAVELKPRDPLASLGLFHSLANARQEKDAFAELRRFLSISESDEHFRLIEEMRDAFDENEEVETGRTS